MAENLGNAGRAPGARPLVQVVWTAEALHELQAAKSYIAQFNPTAADRIAGRLLAAADSLSELPARGRPIAGGRRELVAAPPYILRYRVVGDTVEILTVAHHARRRG